MEITPLWRLIDTGPLDGVSNMSIDEALLNTFLPDSSLPVLRLYGWQPPCISLGRFQKAEEVVDAERCATAGIGIVRRITGGGAIYHRGELTYSLVCSPSSIPHPLSVRESFRVLTSFLLEFYRVLGLAASYAIDQPCPGPALGARTDFCFAGTESYDILIEGRKVGGNAQRRQKNKIFQHGSIPLISFVAEGASFMREHPGELAGRVAALDEFGITSAVEVLKRLLVTAFERTMGVRLVPVSLSPEEVREAAVLGGAA